MHFRALNAWNNAWNQGRMERTLYFRVLSPGILEMVRERSDPEWLKIGENTEKWKAYATGL